MLNIGLQKTIARIHEAVRYCRTTEVIYSFLTILLIINKASGKNKRSFIRQLNKIYTELENDYEAIESTDEALKDMAD